jgi:hypothetical protein
MSKACPELLAPPAALASRGSGGDGAIFPLPESLKLRGAALDRVLRSLVNAIASPSAAASR